MEKAAIIKALEELRKEKKRKFVQSVDLIINLKDIDLKIPENRIDLPVVLPKAPKKMQVLAFIGPETIDQAKFCDLAIEEKNFSDYEGKKAKIRKLAKEYDWFIGQTNLMPAIAKIFGRVLGPRKKMPNPKIGAVFPPKAHLKPLVDKLKKTIWLRSDTQLSIKGIIGKENMSNEEIAENAEAVYKTLLEKINKENIKSILIKFTMSKPIEIK